MGMRLHHPETGAEFDSAASAVPHWQRSGWVPADQWQAQQKNPPGGDGAGQPSTAKATAAAGTPAKNSEE